jgi:hypothetical protein
MMRRTGVKRLALCTVLLTLSPAAIGWGQAATPSSTSPLAAALLAKENAVAEAEKKKDAAALRQDVADDFAGVATNGQPFGRDEMLEGFNEVSLVEYTIYDAQVVQVNEGAAILTYDAIVRISGGDSVIPRYQRVSSLWVSQGGAWKLKYQQATAKKWGD